MLIYYLNDKKELLKKSSIYIYTIYTIAKVILTYTIEIIIIKLHLYELAGNKHIHITRLFI